MLAALWSTVLFAQAQVADFRAASVFSNDMVLQRDVAIPVWGTAPPGGAVSLKFRGQDYRSVADEHGQWQVTLPVQNAGHAGDLVLQCNAKVITFTNVAVGDVWLCSGQSNMEWPVLKARNGAVETKAANYPDIRIFQVARNAAVGWKGEVAGEWSPVTPDTIPYFSAVAYFFGRNIQATQTVPIGLIQSAYGGTPLRAWCPPDALMKVPETAKIVQDYQASMLRLKERDPALYKIVTNPYQDTDDPYNQGEVLGWQKELTDEQLADWREVKVPFIFQDVPFLRLASVVWVRREFTVPTLDSRKSVELDLGPIRDDDIVYINGQRVAETPVGTPDIGTIPRVYRIPPGVIKIGTNLIVIRVHNSGGEAGFFGAKEDMFMRVDNARIPLSGVWLARRPTVFRTFENEYSPRDNHSPSALWDAMLAPLAPFPLKGMLWYQGEEDVADAKTYALLFPEFIRSVRSAWKNTELPFIYVQLPNYLTRRSEPTEKSEWAELREAQSSALALRNTAFTVTIDLGDQDTIHPLDKQPVGYRLSLAARTLAYPGSHPSGLPPVVDHITKIGKKTIVQFKNCRTLTTTNGSAPTGFAVRARGGEWKTAITSVLGGTVVLEHPEGLAIEDIRYAWADNPAVNLVDEENLPASPFRTDKD